MTTVCGSNMNTQATLAARSRPNCAGSERMPILRSPSTLLKSFSVMMPCAPTLYSSAMIRIGAGGRSPPSTMAAPVIQASPS